LVKNVDGTLVWNDSSMRFFLEGTKFHSYREHQYTFGTPVLKEKRIYLRNIEHGYILTGQMDYIGYDHNGYFILDFKTTSYKALYYKWKNKDPFKSNGMQLAIYNYIHYLYSGIEIKNGMLQYIVRPEEKLCWDKLEQMVSEAGASLDLVDAIKEEGFRPPEDLNMGGRHFYNKPYILHSLEETEAYIDQHPAIHYLLDRKNAEKKAALKLAIAAYHKENSFFDTCSCGKILKAKT